MWTAASISEDCNAMERNNYLYFDTIVVGTGAAGYAAACRIRREGGRSVAMVTEKSTFGTSRNTGSDKQTYYKLGLGGSHADSVRTMAGDLFAGGSVDGDNALCEAALSARCFLNLCELGVPFPVNRYGEYIGYKTDHDPCARATSAGPLTSKLMTEALQRWAEELEVPVYEGLTAVEILKKDNAVRGLLCVSRESGELTALECANLVLATGGPAGIYADSVYPASQTGASGLAIAAGAGLQNLTEWQFGLASVQPRWNVSGTYMQVLPRFVSVDREGTEREFLLDYFADPYEALNMVFLKGYQWPFDSRKVAAGSSVIDLLVYRECVMKQRRAYLDYRRNPFGLEQIEFEKLSAEARRYLENAGACFGIPIERLQTMNQPAIDLYAGKGVDLTAEMLQIALCAQHHNGGIGVDMWWQTDVEGLYAVGECAGTHGVTRPGGSALNAGQVGALRAAQHISAKKEALPDPDFAAIAEKKIAEHQALCNSALSHGDNADALIKAACRTMSDVGAAIRDPEKIRETIAQIHRQRLTLPENVGVKSPAELYKLYRLRDVLLTQETVLRAMEDYSNQIGTTRGSALYTNPTGILPEGLSECFRFCPGGSESAGLVQQVHMENDQFVFTWRPVRPIPDGEDFFENIWKQYRIHKNIF